MTFKRFVSACTPSYFVDSVRARRFAGEMAEAKRLDAERAAREKAEVEASSWADAVSRAGNYDEDWFTEVRVARGRNYKPDGSLLITTPLGLIAQMVGKPDLHVTDFGGSLGELGRDLLLSYPRATYCVVETPSLVARLSEEGGLRFSSEMPDHSDVFYSSSTLQYTEDAMGILKRGMRSASSAVILRRNYFSGSVLYGIQKSRLLENGTGPMPEGYSDVSISYPRRTLVETEILALAKSFGFRLLANLEEDAPPGGYSRQLVFWRD